VCKLKQSEAEESVLSFVCKVSSKGIDVGKVWYINRPFPNYL